MNQEMADCYFSFVVWRRRRARGVGRPTNSARAYIVSLFGSICSPLRRVPSRCWELLETLGIFYWYDMCLVPCLYLVKVLWKSTSLKYCRSAGCVSPGEYEQFQQIWYPGTPGCMPFQVLSKPLNISHTNISSIRKSMT